MSHFQKFFNDKCPLYMKDVFDKSCIGKASTRNFTMKLSQPLWSAIYISYLALSAWNNLQNELKRCTNSTHLRQSFLYSEYINKNPP